MARVETVVGRVSREVRCQRCERPIAIGELAVYYSTPPKGSAHLACHLRRRRA
jgi:hypothetical protein